MSQVLLTGLNMIIGRQEKKWLITVNFLWFLLLGNVCHFNFSSSLKDYVLYYQVREDIYIIFLELLKITFSGYVLTVEKEKKYIQIYL